MNVRRLSSALPGEHVVAVTPPLQLRVAAGWQSRPNLYGGRSLGAGPLTADQNERAGRLALRGQMRAPGVVRGLDVRLESAATGDVLRLSPGVGICASGEDTLVARLARVAVGSLVTYVARPSATPGADPVYTLAGADVAHQQFSAVAAAQRTAAAILVLEPILGRTGHSQDPADPAPVDPDAYSFVDEQLVDGCRLVLCTWPTAWLPLPPGNLPQWRSRLAASIFGAERRAPGGTMLWESVGVPLALIGFDAAFRVQFLDRAAVARTGGGPRERTPLLPHRGGPRLWQARIRQLAEHLADLGPSVLASATPSADLRFLPPVGVLPRDAIDVTGWTRRFFPPSFTIEAVPIPLEQLDVAVAASAALEPLDTQASERVRVLVPVPAAHFEPGLLDVRPTIDPAFQAAIDRAQARLGELLGHRRDVRDKLWVLLDAIEGRNASRFSDLDPAAVMDERMLTDDLAVHPEDAFGTASTKASVLRRAVPLDTLFDGWPDGGWETLGGVISGDPAVVSVGPGRLDAFVRGMDSAVWHRSFNGTWGPWEQLGPTPIGGAIAAVVDWASATQPLVHVFARGGAAPNLNKLVHKWSTLLPPAGAAGPSALGPWTEEILDPGSVLLASDPVAVSWGGGRVDVFARGADNQLYGATAALVNTALVYPKLAPLHLILPAQLQGLPSVVSWAAGRLDVFARGADNGLHHFALNSTNNVWGHDVLRGLIRNDPVAVAWGPNRLDVFAERDSNALWQLTWDGSGSWLEWTPRGAMMNATVLHATTWGVGRIDLFVRGADSALWHEWFDGSSWHGWQPLSADLKTEPAAVAWAPGRLDLFAGRVDGSLWHRSKVPDGEWGTLEISGLRAVVSQLDAVVNRINDAVDLGFARVQAAMYRLRQQVLSSTTASRLATSPALADIAQGESALATKQDVASYVAVAGTTRIPGPGKAPPPRLRFLAAELAQPRPASQETFALVRMTRLGGADLPPAAAPAPAAAPPVRAVMPAFMMRSVLQDAMTVQTTVVAASPTVGVVQGQTAIPGAVPIGRSVTIAERLKQPAAIESWQYALSTKYDVLVALANLEIDVSGIQVPGPSSKNAAGSVVRLAVDLVTLRDAAAAAGLLNESHPEETDEGTYFGDAVEFTEHAVIALRAIEGRVETYRNLARLAQTTLDQLTGLAAAADLRLKNLGDQVIEARQDVVVATSFLAEERTRIFQVVARRTAVLARYVPFLVFQRPRQADLFRAAPVRAIDPDVTAEALPAALASTAAAPPELHALIELLREAPVSWFGYAPAIFQRIDRIDAVQRTVYAARDRAASRSLFGFSAVPRGLLGDGILQAFSAQMDVITAARRATAAMDPSVFVSLSWGESQARAAAVISLGDLIDGSHGRLDVARQAAAELENIQKVATALYLRFGTVEPRIRLDWAQRLAQYEAAADLRQLSTLTRWNEIPALDRRELSALTAWLFQRVDASVPRALALANDLVRVAILLASHEPVNEILSGLVPRPATVVVGGTVDISVDPLRVRVGMHALLTSLGDSAHAVVEDISGTLARVRVLSASAARLQLAASTPVQLADPERGTVLFKRLVRRV